MDISEIRHRNFQYVIAQLEKVGIRKRRDQGAKLGGFMSASFVSQLIAGKYIGDDVARKISQALGQHKGWMDQPQWDSEDNASTLFSQEASIHGNIHIQHLSLESDAKDGTCVYEDPQTIRSMNFETVFIRSLLGFTPLPGRLKLVTGRGDSMIPVIHPGETLIVDTAITAFDGDGLYLICTGDNQQIKGLQDRGSSVYVVSANHLYPAFPLENRPIKGKVCLRNRIERLN